MSGMNRVMIIGNLGADPEMRFTQAGSGVLNMRIAATESYLDRNNERQERTEWVTVVVWGKRGEALSKILHKGSTVFVEGRLATRTYEKNGEKRYMTEVVATNIILLGGGRPKESGGAAPQREPDDGHGDAYEGPDPF